MGENRRKRMDKMKGKKELGGKRVEPRVECGKKEKSW